MSKEEKQKLDGERIENPFLEIMADLEQPKSRWTLKYIADLHTKFKPKGKIFVISTVGDMDKEKIDEFKKLWNERPNI